MKKDKFKMLIKQKIKIVSKEYLLINSQFNSTQLNLVKSDNDYWYIHPPHKLLGTSR